MNIRKSVLSGYWFPKNKSELDSSLEVFMKNNKNNFINKKIKAMIVPHAGYKYCGDILGSAYNQLNFSYENVFIFGTAHRNSYEGVSIPDFSHYQIPFGNIKINSISNELLKEKYFKSLNDAHISEHSIEIQLPFLKKIYDDNDFNLSITPLLFGRVNPNEIAECLVNYINENSLIIVSADLSHFLNDEKARNIDRETINKIISLKTINRENATCNPYGINTIIEVAKIKNWETDLLKYSNSSEVTNDYSRVVGYSSIIFY